MTCITNWRGKPMCRFEPRYDTGAPIAPAVNLDFIPSWDLLAVIREHRPVTYVRDVCVRCGKTVDREAPR